MPGLDYLIFAAIVIAVGLSALANRLGIGQEWGLILFVIAIVVGILSSELRRRSGAADESESPPPPPSTG